MESVVLIYPYLELLKKSEFNVPLSLLHLGTYLEGQGTRVNLIDCNTENNYKEYIELSIKRGAICIGISAMTAQLPHAIEICSFIRNKLNSNVPIVFGGVHSTLFPEQMISCSMIDFAVVGEGELALVKLIAALKGESKFDAIGGISFLDDKKRIKIIPKGEYFDFNRMPLLNYNLLNKSVVSQFSGDRYYVGFMTSRGCPYKCTFCINTVSAENRRFRSWSVEKSIIELERLIKGYNVNKVWFWDDGFFVDKKRVLELMNKIEEKALAFEWFASPRADYFCEDYLNEKVLKRLYKMGCRKFGIGAESGSPKILNYLQKDISEDNLIHSAKMCNISGIQPTYSFMVGVPGETSAEVKMSVELIKKLSSICYKARFLGPQLYRPYPGSKLYQDCLKYGLKEPASIEEWVKNINNNIMETNVFMMPWIKDPHLVNTLGFYGILISVKYKKLINLFLEYCKIYEISDLKAIIGLVGITILRLLGMFRYKTNWNNFLIERKIFKKYRAEIGC